MPIVVGAWVLLYQTKGHQRSYLPQSLKKKAVFLLIYHHNRITRASSTWPFWVLTTVFFITRERILHCPSLQLLSSHNLVFTPTINLAERFDEICSSHNCLSPYSWFTLLYRFRVSSRNVQEDLELRIRLHQLLFTPEESFSYDDTHRLNNAKRARLRHNNQTWPDSFKSSAVQAMQWTWMKRHQILTSQNPNTAACTISYLAEYQTLQDRQVSQHVYKVALAGRLVFTGIISSDPMHYNSQLHIISA